MVIVGGIVTAAASLGSRDEHLAMDTLSGGWAIRGLWAVAQVVGSKSSSNVMLGLATQGVVTSTPAESTSSTIGSAVLAFSWRLGLLLFNKLVISLVPDTFTRTLEMPPKAFVEANGGHAGVDL